ncbi:AAA domain-containing protein [Xylanibacter ruminicola]|uniref:AAA domain-containing protein n=1 Tax=Xylanibacter ruminicola TaxID=839 RepID=A0A1H4AG45_XYLRU|nr:AAA domain-containing protein [Xylanibacter ruminicola]SEA34979.1 AAA domain-containing protein [Xylanibacter ruminicola]
MELIQNLSNAIDLQQKRQDEDYSEMVAKPLAERVAKGHTLTNLSISKIDFYDGMPNSFCPPVFGNQKFIDRIYIHCKNNCSRYREGTALMFSNGNLNFKMELETDKIDDFILHSGDFDVKNNILDSTNYPKSGWELNAVNQNITQRLLKASWQRLYDNPELAKKMEMMLNGNLYNGYDSLSFSRGDLNDSQNTAVRKALGCSHFSIIQGPPGTGKTYTIAKLCAKLVEQGLKVFITGPTHTAINNCLIAVAKDLKDKSKIVKIGEKYQAAEILDNPWITRKTRLSYYSYVGNNNFSQMGFVIGATPFALCFPAAKKLEAWNFDYIIIDEAAQVSMPLALAAMTSGKKVIFVGDHMQLDPIIPKNTDNWLFGSSVFKRMVDLYPDQVVLLNQSYRLNKNLIDIPNQLFYAGKISSCCPIKDDFKDFLCRSHPEIINHSSNELLIIHHDFGALGRSPFEAEMIADMVLDLLYNGVNLDHIGIISPYRAQIREIKRALVEKNVLNEDNLDSIFVDTVERMQGQEKDYIFFSLANCNPEEVEDRLDFFYSPNRLNVAITRAHIKCITLTNEKIFKICRERIGLPGIPEDLKKGMKAFLDFEELSTKIEIEDENVTTGW